VSTFVHTTRPVAFCSQRANPPQQLNEVTVSIALAAFARQPDRQKAVLANHGQFVRRDASHPSKPQTDRLAAIQASAGPGSQLWRLLESLGVQHKSDCACLTRAEQMNAWGQAGCREHRDEILTWMREGQDRFGWRDKLTAATRAVTTGLAFRLNPLDPFPASWTRRSGVPPTSTKLPSSAPWSVPWPRCAPRS